MSPKIRLTVYRGAAVADYQAALQSFLAQRGTRDLGALLRGLTSLTWKAAPKASTMGDYADLALGLVTHAARNGVLSHAKLQTAILSMHKEAACLFGRDPVEFQANRLSNCIRMLLSQYREVKKNGEKERVVMSKARVIHVFMNCMWYLFVFMDLQ